MLIEERYKDTGSDGINSFPKPELSHSAGIYFFLSKQAKMTIINLIINNLPPNLKKNRILLMTKMFRSIIAEDSKIASDIRFYLRQVTFRVHHSLSSVAPYLSNSATISSLSNFLAQDNGVSPSWFLIFISAPLSNNSFTDFRFPHPIA